MQKFDFEFVLKVLNATQSDDACNFLRWSTNGGQGPVTFWIICDDWFRFDDPDEVELSPENIEQLEQSIKDIEAIVSNTCWASYLFCCRIKKMRPDYRWYIDIPAPLHHLFDACGPQKELELVNSLLAPIEPPFSWWERLVNWLRGSNK